MNKNFFPVTLKRIDSQVFFLEGVDKESPHEVGSKTVNLDLLVNLRDTSKVSRHQFSYKFNAVSREG